MKKFIEWLNEEKIKEGIRKIDGQYEFDWQQDLPDDLMSLKFKKYRGKKQQQDETEYTYYYAYQIDKSSDSTDLLVAIKMMERSISDNDLRMFVNKAVIGFDQTFGINKFDTILAPQSSSLILSKLVAQLKDKSRAQVFPNSFAKTSVNDISLDMERVDKLPEKTRKEVLRAFNRMQENDKPFKIKDVYSRHRKFYRDFIKFNSEKDRQLFNAITDKKIILVDDYKTSGSTVKEMLKQLIESGAQEIVVFILIRLGE
jgi:phosphoribosylpyrophosphate synthetase